MLKFSLLNNFLKSIISSSKFNIHATRQQTSNKYIPQRIARRKIIESTFTSSDIKNHLNAFDSYFHSQ